MRSVLARAAGALALLGCLAVPGPASAAPTEGSPGPCPGLDGVTVVIDFQALGRDTIVRCAPGSPTSGFDALARAGISFSQVSSNPGFLCKIEGLPAAEGYANRCAAIPPTNAYWAYWVAPRGQAWCYSNVGAGRVPVPGTVEGWSFSSGKTEASAPPPRTAPPPHIAGAPTSVTKATCPSPPTTASPATVAPTTVGPTTTAPDPGAGPRDADGSSQGGGSRTSPTASAGDDPPVGADGSGAPMASGDADASTSSTRRRTGPEGGDLELADDDGGGSPTGALVGLGAVAIGGGAAAVTARRRRRT